MTTCLRAALLVILLVWQANILFAAECKPLKASGSKCVACTHIHCEADSKPAAQPNISVTVILPTPHEIQKDKEKKSNDKSATILRMSTENLIQTLLLITAILAFFIAAFQFMHVKKLEADKLTLELWKQYLADFGKYRSAFLTMNNPMNTSVTDFTNIQSLRSWIDGVATLGTHKYLINKKLIISFGLDGPIDKFMALLQQSTNELQRLALLGVPRAQDLFLKYQREINLSANIFKWLKTL
ncbi:hypothetical protein [Pseudomonas arsenicoxydans]|nr:hypothetical protein [Pseudomonas arsenicoxydans]